MILQTRAVQYQRKNQPIRDIIAKEKENIQTLYFCIRSRNYISEPVPVKNIDYMDETQLSTVEDTIDREPKDGDVWTKIEYIRDTENTQDGISFSVNHRYGDMNTPSYKEEDIRPMEMVISPDLILSDKHKLKIFKHYISA